jgi:RNA polymerase sigma-70 factor (ECF subfamily)
MLAPPNLPPDLVAHTDELLRWATCQMPAWVRQHLDPSDLVQQTLLEVWREGRLNGLAAPAARGYLFRALANNLIDALRKYAPARNDVSPDALAESSMRMADWVAANDTSPSERAERNERFARLAGELAKLPEAQRIAVEMRYLLGMKVIEIARVLNRTADAVSLLLYRALSTLRTTLDDTRSGDQS